MQKLPKDIIDKIEQTYSLEQRELVIEKLGSLWETELNVGEEQLARSILIIADGDMRKVEEIFETKFYRDPRDLIMYAASLSENKTYYGIEPFEK